MKGKNKIIPIDAEKELEFDKIQHTVCNKLKKKLRIGQKLNIIKVI